VKWVWFGVSLTIAVLSFRLYRSCEPVITGPESVYFPCDGPGAFAAEGAARVYGSIGMGIAAVILIGTLISSLRR